MMKKSFILVLVIVLISMLSTYSYAKQKDEDRYPIPLRTNYTSVVGNMDKTSNIFNNQVKQKMFKKSMKHFQTVTLAKGHYTFKPNADGFHGSRGLQWIVDADFNNNVIMLGLLVTTSTTRLQGPVGVKVVQIETPFGTDKFNFPNSISDYSYSMGYSDIGTLFPNTNDLNTRMANILNFMLKSEPKQTTWYGYGLHQNVGNTFSEKDIRGMKDAVELFELLIST